MRIPVRTLNCAHNTTTSGKPSISFRLCAVVVFLLALALPLSMQAQNFVYVNNQGATNTITAFSVDHAGLLTAVPGSPFATGGTGATVACSAVDRMTISATGDHLFVSNGGDLTVSVFQISPTTGALTAAPGSPVASGLTLDSCTGISLAATPDGKFLMASSNGVIKTFNVAASGALTSTVAPVTGLPVPMVGMKVSGNGQWLAAANHASVSVFSINGVDGTLTPTPGSPFAKTGAGLLSGVEFNCDGTLLYGGEGGATTSITDAWSIALNGALTPVLGTPFGATGNDSNIVFLTPDNTLLYQSNQLSNDLNAFSVNADGTITSIGIFGGPANTHSPAGLTSDNTGLFLYAADDTFGLAIFNILPGVVPTLVSDTPFTPAGQIQGIAAYPPRSCAHTNFTVTQTASPNPVTAGNNITYNITVTNNGPTAAAVAINDLLPRADMTFLSCASSLNGVCDNGAGLNRTITFASLAPGESGTVTLVGKTVATLLNLDTITNTSTTSNSSAVDTNPADNSATTNVTVSAPPSATNIVVGTASIPYFGTGTLTATLHRTAPGALIANRTLAFTVDGVPVSSAVTNASGVASVPVNVGTLVSGGLPAGAHQIGVSFASDAQFAASTGTAVLTITPATLTVTAQPASRVYGDANPVFTFAITGFLGADTVAVVAGAPTCSSSSNVNSAAGSGTIICVKGTLAASNYTFAFVSAVLTITKAPLVAAGTNVTRPYGDPNPVITGTVQGLKSGDQANATFSTTAVTTSPVGAYPINGQAWEVSTPTTTRSLPAATLRSLRLR